eukprot:451140_1
MRAVMTLSYVYALQSTCSHLKISDNIRLEQQYLNGSISIHQQPISWENTIPDQDSLLETLSNASFELAEAQLQMNTPYFDIMIGKHAVARLSLQHFDAMQTTITFLELMQSWHKHHQNTSNAQISELLKLVHTTTLNKQHFDRIYKLLSKILGDEFNFDLLFDWIYYQPYTLWMSHNRLHVLLRIGSGTQAEVFAVKDVNNGDLFALKIFHPHQMASAMYEEIIYLRIENEIYTNQSSTRRLCVPRIKHFNITGFDHGAILTELVDAITFDDIIFDTKTVTKMRKQLLDTIRRLAAIGIGHFDIQPGNVLCDTSGNFWLIDFGLGVNIELDWSIRHVNCPLIGTWLFYSPFAYQLNMFLCYMKRQRMDIVPEGYKEMVKESIHDADIYSLESMILYETNSRARNGMFQRFYNQCVEIWRKGDRMNIKPLEENLDRIWFHRSKLVVDLLYQKHASVAASTRLLLSQTDNDITNVREAMSV